MTARLGFGSMEAAAFAGHPAFAGFHAQLLAEGYVLRPLTQPWLRADGSVLVRLVWRRRADTACAVLQQTLRAPVDEALLDALAAAMRP